jgi:hypothetical protein
MTTATNSSRDPQYWLASKPPEVETDQLASYLAKQEWVSPKPMQHAATLATMVPGDMVVLKSVTNQSTGLPFFNADKPVSAMTIYATGEIRAVNANAGSVSVQWTPLETPRDWYFFTYLATLVRIDLEKGPRRQELIDFCFNNGVQDFDYYLAEPFWASRYPAPPGFTWIPFYEECGSKLLEYRHDRGPLVQLLLEIAQGNALLGYLVEDRFPDGSAGPIVDIDPFTVMGAFNRGLTLENRQQVAELLAERLGVMSPLPSDFHGIPVLNNQNSWFISYSKSRGENDVQRLWTVFAAGLSLAQSDTEASRSDFIAAYDDAQEVRGVKWNLSQGLFWFRPDAFVPLDRRSRAFLKERFGTPDPDGGEEYLALRDRLRGLMSASRTSITSFPLLSYAAWQDSSGAAEPHSVVGFAYWAARMAESIDLDASENDYKRQTAALLATARDQARSGESRWTESFNKALQSTNTLDFRFKDDLHKASTSDPDGLLRALDSLWEKPAAASLDELQATLRALLGKLTPGNATGLGAALLMADDPESNAPFGPSRVQKWYQLTGRSGPKDGKSASARYASMLEFLDDLSSELADQLGRKPSRLEAQGLSWAVTEHPIPESWDQADRTALLAWREQSTETSRAWLVRAKKVSVADWLEEGYVSLAATYLGSVPGNAKLKEVTAAVEAGYQHEDYSQRKSLAEEYFAFLTTMKPGDIVATQSDTSLHIGVVASDPDYVEDANDRLRRTVSWKAEANSENVSSSLQGLLDLQGNVVDITQGLEVLAELLDDDVAPTEIQPELPQEAPSVDSIPQLPKVTTELVTRLHIKHDDLQEIVDLVHARQQIVLYGPPGTGKTFLAMALARHIVGPEDRSRVQLVQFHPSYAYEDFFEGYRPTETGQGQATFELKPGPLRRIAADARANPGSPYVLIIDELNRANLAKVFGELYFLLEYRRESIQLQYQPKEAFQLPRNLFFIGTMNTADRSIALLDAAMRRRFSFVELHPDEPPIRDVLSKWLESNKFGSQRAKLMAALNAAIEEQDRDLRIGPSYLMRSEAGTDAGLRRVWKYDILPLLEEHYYGRLTRDELHRRFGLDALLAGLSGQERVEVERVEDPDDLFAGESESDPS